MKGEPIQMLERKFTFFPAKFQWKGQIFEVDAVQTCYTEMGKNSSKPFHNFIVRCGRRLYHLAEDATVNRWSIISEDA